MTRPLSGLSKSSHIYRAALNMNTLGELFAGMFFAGWFWCWVIYTLPHEFSDAKFKNL